MCHSGCFLIILDVFLNTSKALFDSSQCVYVYFFFSDKDKENQSKAIKKVADYLKNNCKSVEVTDTVVRNFVVDLIGYYDYIYTSWGKYQDIVFLASF